jgi:hypothetical protein
MHSRAKGLEQAMNMRGPGATRCLERERTRGYHALWAVTLEASAEVEI